MRQKVIARRAVVRFLHVDVKTMALVEKTLMDREIIRLGRLAGDGMAVWELLDARHRWPDDLRTDRRSTVVSLA